MSFSRVVREKPVGLPGSPGAHPRTAEVSTIRWLMSSTSLVQSTRRLTGGGYVHGTSSPTKLVSGYPTQPRTANCTEISITAALPDLTWD